MRERVEYAAAIAFAAPIEVQTMRYLAFAFALLALAACGPSRMAAAPEVATTLTAANFGDGVGGIDPTEYRIGPADKLRLSVFQVPDLSFESIAVDSGGQLQLPLIGSVQAAGLTPQELSTSVRGLLAERYLRNPQVSVSVTEAASQKVTVDGAVMKPGVYMMRGRTTLLQAVAMAEGAADEADLRSVAVFRTVDGRRMIGVFDLAAIRNGQAEDLQIRGDDVVVVDTSRLSAAIRNVITALPGLAVFAYL